MSRATDKIAKEMAREILQDPAFRQHMHDLIRRAFREDVMEQQQFNFQPNQTDLIYARVVMRWRAEINKVEAWWPDFQLTSWFDSWPEALRYVLHPLNKHVRVRVRP